MAQLYGEYQEVIPNQKLRECFPSDKAKEHYIRRFLANPLILPLHVIGGFVPEIL